jgi:hypothetical protein
MGRRPIAIALVWTALVTTAAAAASPAELAEPWVVRADRDLPRVIETESTEFPQRKYDLSAAAYDASPTDARRTAVVKKIRDSAAIRVSRAASRQTRAAELIYAAAALAEVDDLDGARQLLADSDASTTLPADRLDRRGETTPFARAYVLVRLGEADRITDLPGDTYDTVYVAKFCDAGREEMAGTLRSLVEQAVAAATEVSPNARTFYLARAGFWSDALAVAETASSESRAVALKSEIAEWAFLAGNHEALRECEIDLLARAQQVRNPDDYRNTARYLSGFAAAFGDREMVDRLCALVETNQAPDAAYQDADRLASAYAAVHNTPKFLEQVARARSAMVKLDTDPKADLNTRRGERADVAASYARAGDRAAVDALLKAMPEPGTDSNSLSIAVLRRRPELQFIDGGFYDDALAMAAQDDPKETEPVYSAAARGLAAAGRFDDARKAAAHLINPHKLEALYAIAKAQARSGQTDGLAAWIDALPSPIDRVVLNLAVANAITGRSNRWLDDQMDTARLF